MFAKIKGIVWLLWLLCVSFAEVGIILLCARRLGAQMTFCLFAGTALIGLLVQMVRWKKRFKLLSEEASRLFEVMTAKSNKIQDWQKLPEYERWWQVTIEKSQYWIVTFLLVVPGFLCHLLAFLFIVPVTRPIAWWLLSPGRRSYHSIGNSRDTKLRLPGSQRRL